MVGLIGSGGAGGGIDADEVLSIVDGSDVKVAEAVVADGAAAAEDADALGGQPPSAFETPNSTSNFGQGGGWSSAPSPVGLVIDGARLSSNSNWNSMDVTLMDGRSYGPGPGESVNFEPGLVSSYDSDTYGDGSFHFVGLVEHNHPI